MADQPKPVVTISSAASELSAANDALNQAMQDETRARQKTGQAEARVRDAQRVYETQVKLGRQFDPTRSVA